jgi:hypothetical protein
VISRRSLLLVAVGQAREFDLSGRHKPSSSCPVCSTKVDEIRFVLEKLLVRWCPKCGNLWATESRPLLG